MKVKMISSHIMRRKKTTGLLRFSHEKHRVHVAYKLAYLVSPVISTPNVMQQQVKYRSYKYMSKNQAINT